MSRRRRQSGTGISLFTFQDIITCVMGIMLLLTLLLCLQISTTVVSEFSPQKIVDETSAKIESLNEQIQTLSAEVANRQILLDSGVIEDVELLKQKVQQTNSDIQRATLDLSAAEQSAKQSQLDLQQMQQQVSARQSQVEETQTLQRQISDMQASLQRLQSGERILYNGQDAALKQCWLVELKSDDEFLAAELGRKQAPRTFATISSLRTWMLAHQDRSYLLIVKPESADIFDSLTQQLRQQNVTFGFDLLPNEKMAIDPVSGAGT